MYLVRAQDRPVLRQIADNLWTLDRGRSVLGIELGARMTIVRVRGGRLLLHSPVRMDADAAGEVRKLGPVAMLIAPSKMHYLFVEEARTRFVDARVIAAPGLREKRPGLHIDAEFNDRLELPEEIDWHVMGGMPGLNEVVFHHRPSRTLIASDLFFNFVSTESWLTRTYLRLNGAYGKPKQTGLLRAWVKDRAAFATSRDYVLRWDFDRVIVAHGEIVQTGGRAALSDALGWA